MDQQSTSLNVLTAVDQISRWNDLRNTATEVNGLFQDLWYFKISADFDTSHFEEEEIAHAYFSIRQPATGPPTSEDLSLLIISRTDDQSIVGGASPYIYEAPYINPELGEVINEKKAYEMIEDWKAGRQDWVDTMVGMAEGMTLVSDIPLEGLIPYFKRNHGLYVYLGLRDALEEELRLGLLFYDTDSGQFVNLGRAGAPHDFTTPRPPFGGGLANYGLYAQINP